MLKSFVLLRVTRTPDGVFGVLMQGSKPFAVTLEPEDKDNQKGISCIPEGLYYCEPWASPKFGRTYEVLNVPNRDKILIHSGNLEEHTKGCILIGESFGELSGKTAILDSRKGQEEFLLKAGGSQIMLTIIWAFK